MTARHEGKAARPPSRRTFLKYGVAAAVAGGGGLLARQCVRSGRRQPVVILRAKGYHDRLRQHLAAGLKELGVGRAQLAGKRVVLKPNLLEPEGEAAPINTHPLLVQAAIELFLSLDAASVTVAEGTAHVRDHHLLLEESHLADVLAEDNTPFVDLNFAPAEATANVGRKTRLPHLFIPELILRADFLVSVGKMKTHHWAGATLSMKNLFGVMPGAYYGWPKNPLHVAGIHGSILDVNATVRPQLAIVDGIVGMEGDGPVMGTPVEANVLVMGTNLPAVDATCARIMGLIPRRLLYLRYADGQLGPIDASRIEQRGEELAGVRKEFRLLDYIPAHRGLREPA